MKGVFKRLHCRYGNLYVKKITITYSPMVRQVVLSNDKEWSYQSVKVEVLQSDGNQCKPP